MEVGFFCPLFRERGTMSSFRELLADTKAQIREVTPHSAESKCGEATFVDVREIDEYDQGAIPGAVHIPRGFLESQIESRITNQDTSIVVYCAGGARSAFAAKTLSDMGYTNV